MSDLIVTLVVAGSFLAGYLLRGLLAVAWERKRQHRPLSGLSNRLLHGLIDLSQRCTTSAAGEARLALVTELERRPDAGRRQGPGRAFPSVSTSPHHYGDDRGIDPLPPVKTTSPGPLPRSHPRQRGEQGW